MAYTRPSGSATDFSFTGISYTRPAGSIVDFSFVPESTGPVVDVNVTGSFAPLTVRARIAPNRKVNVTGSFAPLTVSVSAQYLSNTARPLVNHTTSRHQKSVGVQIGVGLDHQEASLLHTGWASHHTYAEHFSAWIESKTPQIFRRVKDLFLSDHQAGKNVRGGLYVRHQEADRTMRLMLNSAFEAASLARASTLFSHQDGSRTRTERGSSHQEASLTGRWIVTRAQTGAPMSRVWYAEHEEAMRATPGLSYPPIQPPPEPEFSCYTPDGKLLFELPWENSGFLIFKCDDDAGGPPPGATVVVPVRRVYVTTNNITLHRLDTGAELHAHNFDMALDEGAWTWTWSAVLHHDAEGHLGRDTQGDPAELVAVVNGIQFRLRLQSVARDRRFSTTRFNVNGLGRAMILGAPYTPPMQFGNPEDARTAQQLMADVLMINGVSIGWGVEWGLEDWLVPAGAWSFNGTYIDAINDIAKAAGGYVQPHATDAILRILPRYPVKPWAWGAVTPAFEIPEDAAEVEGIEYIDKPAYNGVFVGGTSAGVFGPFKRTGTAGDVLAPQVNHALITDEVAHRQRGLAVISDTGRQEHVTISMQVLPATGVIVPGQFVRYQADKTYMGIVRSTRLSWQRPRLRQQLRIETHA